MSRVFISYSKRRAERQLLVDALRDHGLRPWRDVESIPTAAPTTATIEGDLAGCAAAILWVDQAFLDSEFIRLVELPAIEDARRLRGLRILPVFDGMGPTEATDRLSALGFEVGDHNGHVVDEVAAPASTAAAVAARYLDTHLRDAHAAGRPPVLRVVSYDDTAELRDEAVLNLDWRHRLTTGSLPPDDEQALRRALETATAAVKRTYGAAELTLAIKTHLPLAVAVGHAFAEPTGCRLVMRRGSDVLTTTRTREPVPALVRSDRSLGPVTAGAGAVEVAVSRDVGAGVTELVAAGTRYRRRAVLTPPSGPSRDAVPGPTTAAAWGRQIAETVLAEGDCADVDRVDLFLATPVELAVMVGWWLNASGPVHVMNWRGKTGPYERMWTLP